MRGDLLAFVDDGEAGLVKRAAGDRQRPRAAGQSGRGAVGVAHDHVDALGIDAELIRDQLLVRGNEPGAVFLVAHHQLDAVILEFDRRGFGKAAAAAVGISGHADAAQLAGAFAMSAALRKRGPFRRFHGALHHFLELTGIEQEFGRRGVRHRRRRHEIDTADGTGVLPSARAATSTRRSIR